uniref:LITAF domain-containing protein n=1 Tax=Meloidogyne hapla TaxID=6305 RepID=A0A1I8BYN1_MELHA
MSYPMLNNPMLGPFPVMFHCNVCGADTLTRVVKNPNMAFFMGCFLLTIFSLFCFTPFLCCWDSAFDYSHHCGICGSLLGTTKNA